MTGPVSPAPLDLETVLSAAWLGAVLTPPAPGMGIAAVKVVEELVSVATKVRFRVDYEGDAGRTASIALCAKGYFGERGRRIAALGRGEAHFYADVAPGLAVRIPACAHAGVDPDTGHGVVLLADLLDAGCTFLTPLSLITVDQSAGTLDELARLHGAAPRLGHLRAADWLAPRIEDYLGYVSEQELQAQLDDGRAEGLSPDVRDARRLRAAVVELARRSRASSACVIHGDTHAGNLYLDPEGRPGLLDWQIVQWGWWALDVAYHVSAALPVDDRAAHERALLAHYLDAARVAGADVPSDADAWEAYRDALAYGYFLWAITRHVKRPIVEEFVHRLGTAVQTHDSLDRLGV